MIEQEPLRHFSGPWIVDIERVAECEICDLHDFKNT